MLYISTRSNETFSIFFNNLSTSLEQTILSNQRNPVEPFFRISTLNMCEKYFHMMYLTHKVVNLHAQVYNLIYVQVYDF